MPSTIALRLIRFPAAPSDGQSPEPRQLIPRALADAARANIKAVVDFILKEIVELNR